MPKQENIERKFIKDCSDEKPTIRLLSSCSYDYTTTSYAKLQQKKNSLKILYNFYICIY